jgi:nitrosocyanin
MKLLISLFIVLGIQSSALAEKRTISVVNHEFEGTKQWLPGTIYAKKGDEVTLKLINKAPSGLHGFQIPAFKIKENLKKGETKKVTFKADKAGIFQINCHLHAAHVGGQLVITE